MKIGGTKQKKYGQYATGEEIFRVICKIINCKDILNGVKW
jgi:hypothetical protein